MTSLIKKLFSNNCNCSKMQEYNDSWDLIMKSGDNIYIVSEGGHKGREKIDYCPFCGGKLESDIITERTQ